MIYKLAFREEALKEWKQLAPSVREQFMKKLAERCNHPCIPADRLSGARGLYKIKLRKMGFRLVYEVQGEVLIVVVVAVGKRERNWVYKRAA